MLRRTHCSPATYTARALRSGLSFCQPFAGLPAWPCLQAPALSPSTQLHYDTATQLPPPPPQDDEPYVSLQVGKTVWADAPRAMRSELWMSALQRRPGGCGADVQRYAEMLSKVRWQRK